MRAPKSSTLRSAARGRRDELLAGFRGGLYAFTIVIDIGAYRDLHRHRRCQKFRQAFSGGLGYDTPAAHRRIRARRGRRCGARPRPGGRGRAPLPAPAAEYLLPFAARSRFLFKMDFRRGGVIIAKLRSGVKGHFSYRGIAWEMKEKLAEMDPELGRLIDATPPWIEDPLKR